MSDQALMLRNDAALTLTFTPQAESLKRQALEVSALIGKVTDADSNERAVNAQTTLAALIKLVEEARVAAKEPILTFASRIETAAKEWTEEIRSEQWRVSQLVGDYQQLEQAKARAAQQAETLRLEGLEADRQQELANAKSHDEMDQINERYDAHARSTAPVRLA